MNMNISDIFKAQDFDEFISYIKNVKCINGIIQIIKNNDEYFEWLKAITSYMPNDASIYYRIFLLKHDIYMESDLPKCKQCGNLLTDKDLRKYFQNNGYCFCSPLCYSQYPKSEENRKKTSEHMKKQWAMRDDEYKENFYNKVAMTNLQRYNTKCTLNTEENIRKKKETWQRNYGEGIDNPLKAKTVKDKVAATNNVKYKSNCPLNDPAVKEKSKKTLYENYQVENPMQSPVIIEKIRQRSREKHGTEWIPKTEESWKKYCATMDSKKFKMPEYHKYHTYTFESGKEILVQGYEGIALDYYILNNYSEDDIENTISFMYLLNIKYTNDDGSEHRYIPDFYIKSKNLIIEVKSAFTFYTDLTKILKKCQAAINSGYDIQVLIFEHVNRNKTNVSYVIYDYNDVLNEYFKYKQEKRYE